MPPKKKSIDEVVGEIKTNANSPVLKDDERVEFLNTGSTLLNLALSQKGRSGGIARGRICNVVGDKASAKTLLCLEVAAHSFYNIQKIESKIYPPVEKINIVFNNIEGSLDFPIQTMYGNTFNEGITWVQTPIAEDFGKDYQQRLAALKKGEFMLYIVDSVDALVAQAAADRMDQTLNDKKADASYGTEKAKFFSSSFFNHLCGGMKGKDSTLICVSQIRENIGVCFDYYSKVWLADGTTEYIGKIVNQKMKVDVLSYNKETGRIEPKQITDWHNNGVGDDFLKIKISSGFTGSRILTVTPNHLVFTPNGEIEAKNLKKGDKVIATGTKYYSTDQHNIILGSIFGDGSLRWQCEERATLRLGHCKEQFDYCQWKAESLNAKIKIMKNGVNWADTVRSNDYLFYKDFPQKDKRKNIPQKYIDKLNEKSIAIWYMDDGTFSGSYEKWGNGTCSISAKNLDNDTLQRIAKKIQELDMGVVFIKEGKGLLWSGENSRKFQEKITKYIHPSMKYKIKNTNEQFCWDIVRGEKEICVVEGTVIENKKAKEVKSYKRNKYDLTIQDNSSYIVSGVIVHNSFGEKYYRTGGKSFDFYAQQVLWLAVVEKMKKTFRGQDKIYGVKVRGKVKKNKTALPFREADFKILFDFGIDDISSMIDYLYGPKEKECDWQGQKIKSAELIRLVDSSLEDLELLKNLVEKDWFEIEEAIKPERKPRFAFDQEFYGIPNKEKS